MSAGQEVLDVGAGDGNFALVAAYEGASVVASDIAPGMVERGRLRFEAEGYEADWVEADVEDLPFDDARFDCAGSVFGAMFAPRPEVAAAEMFRVVRPGGTVGMAAWKPRSFADAMFDVFLRYMPPRPAEVPEAVLWGSEDVVRERFGALAGSIEFESHEILYEARSADELWKTQQTIPTLAALRRSLDDDAWSRLGDEFIEFVRAQAGPGDGPVSIRSEYLISVARKRG